MAPRRKKTTKTAKSSNVKLKRLEAQTRVICTFNRIIFAVIGLVLGLAVVASALPQKRNLQDLEFKLARAQEEEKRVLAEKEYREIEYRAMKEDPAFLELKAMDRLNVHREGERVFRIKRAED
jgi:septum formation inhibitor-activating ATPase MinD